MTSASAVPEIGGVGAVLIIWSLLVVIIGASLFGYGIVVTVRGHNRRKRRRRGPVRPATSRPLPPPPASRPFMLPSGPTAGGVPVGRHVTTPRPRALPAGPTSRPLALPGGSWPQAGHPAGSPGHTGAAGQSASAAAHHPAGPGSGYEPGPAPVGPAPPRPPRPMPARLPDPPAALPPGPIAGQGYATTALPAIYGTPPASPVSAPSAPPPPSQAVSGVPATYGGAAPTAWPHPSEPGMEPGAPHPGDPYAAGGPAIASSRADPSPAGPERSWPFRRARADECATLRAECDQLREIAATVAEEAAQAAALAEAAHSAYVQAQRDADEARRGYDAIIAAAAEMAAQVAALERPVEVDERLQAETSHAAFAAYRRGDISSEQLREVFRRAEGWTPEHDRIARRSTELRAEEAEAMRARDAALQAEQEAAEQARASAVTARTLDEKARTAAADARGRCAAADACEQRQRRR